MKIVSTATLNDDIRITMSEIFVDGFYQWLHFFSKDKVKLAKALSHMFLLDHFYVGLIDEKVAGFVAYTNGLYAPIKLNKKLLKKHLGFIRGTIAYLALSKMLEKHKYPFPKTEDIGSIEYVVTNSKFRNQGVASTIIKHIIGDTPHTTYVLEVADNNIPAIKCYQKLGFTDFLTVPNKNSKAAGFNNFLYMKYLKEEAN